MSKEAMKLALEALEAHADIGIKSDKAIAALREALAEQPAQRQEPVISTAHGPWIPSTHPGEEGESYCKRCLLRDKFLGSRQCDPHIVPPEQPAQQEPVAWMWRCKPYCNWPEWSVSLKRPADSGCDGHKRTEGYEDVPLYTSQPAQRPWAGLTDEEVKECFESVPTQDCQNYEHWRSLCARNIEAKLKEKNT